MQVRGETGTMKRDGTQQHWATGKLSARVPAGHITTNDLGQLTSPQCTPLKDVYNVAKLEGWRQD